MALCDGERKTNGQQCYGTLYKCTQCGNVGCIQNKDHLCSKQGFTVVKRCYQCGAIGKLEMLPSEGRAPRKTPEYI